jgi:asparagine synthase (glutamine-hydrolysing)
MNALVAHRGPDDAGEIRDAPGEVALAMQRLAILDLAGGRQPMVSEDESLWIVHNGEIYNSPELRRDLEARGRRFVTANSDTEVLLHLYAEKQEGMLADLNGMFAFVLYDRTRRMLFGARDRVGIKPLYYAQDGARFAFASELKCFLPLPWIARDVDAASLFHYLSLRFVPGEASILGGVRRLAPGHWFRYDVARRELEIRPYWRLDLSQPEQRSPAEWRERIRHGLRDAVRRWVLSDVPVGCSLSGGLDSATIVGVLGELGYAPIRTYSLGFAGPGEAAWNELPLARRVAQRWGTQHHELTLDPDDLLRDLVRMVWHLDEPYGGGLPSWYVFEFMRRHVTVGLTGTGGDELFGDYGRYARLERAAAPGPARWWEAAWPAAAAGLRRVSERWRDPRRARAWTRPPALRREPFRRHYFDAYYYWPDAAKRGSLFARNTAAIPDTSDVLERSYRAGEGAGPRDRVAALAFATQLPEEFLLMTDRFSMAHSLEARVPFLDHTFVELVARIPAAIRSRPDGLKYLLKAAVGDLLPAEVRDAPKRGFVIPTALWLRGKLRPLAERLLAPERLAAQGLFRPEVYAECVRPHLEGRADHHARIWTLLMFQLWHLLFVEERLTGPPAFSWRDVV